MKQRWLVVAGWLVALAAGLAIVLPARLVTDLGAFLPAAATPEQELLVDQLRHGATSGLLMIAAGSPERPVEAGELERLRERLDATGLFRMVATRPDPERLAGRDVLLRYRYLLSDRWSPDDFTVPGLRATFAGVVERLRRPGMPADERLLARDPTGELRHLLGAWLGGDGPTADAGGWRLDDGRALILAVADAPAYDLAAQARALRAVEQQAGGHDPAIPVEIGGAPAVAVGSRDIIRAEVMRVSLLASMAVILVLVAALRSLPAVILALVPVISGLVAGAAAVRLGFGEIHGITLAFGVTLLGVTVDYPLHHLWHSRLADRVAAARTIRRPLLVGAASTAVGFAALAIAGVQGLQQLALLSVTGIVTAAVVTSWVLPALAPQARGSERWAGLPPPRCPAWLPTTLAAALLLGGALAAAGGLRMSTDLAAMSPVPAELAARDGELRRALGLAEPRLVVTVDGATREQALRETERVSARLDELVDAGRLGRFEAVDRLLPSAARQRERAAALPGPDRLAAAVARATAGLPLRADAFEPFIRDVDASRDLPPLVPRTFPEGMLRDWIEARLIGHGDGWVSLIHLAGVDEPGVDEPGVDEIGAVAAALDDARLVDLQAETSRLVTGYQRRAMLHFAFGAVLIAGVLLAGTASPRRTLQILLIAGGAVGGTTLSLAAFGATLSVFHVIALLLVVGLGIDYGIFARPGDRVGTGSVTVCALSSAVAFALLATADIPLLRAIGMTVACGTVLAWGLALLFASTDQPMGQTMSQPKPPGTKPPGNRS